MKHKDFRDICHEFTELNEEEIQTIGMYINDIQNMASEEKANVYIDCLSLNPRLMIIAGEAFPEGEHSIYSHELLGKVIKMDNEPAVKRTFVTGLPTTRVLAVSVPSEEKVIQSAFPIMHNSKVVGVLIFEKLLKDVAASDLEERDVSQPVLDLSDNGGLLLNAIKEALLFVDGDFRICFGNKAAEELFRNLGYTESLVGMDIYNFWPEKIRIGASCSFLLSGRKLSGNVYSLNLMGNKDIQYVILIEDRSEIFRLKEEKRVLHNEIHEERHAWKNQIMFLQRYVSDCMEQSESEEARNAYNKINNRLDLSMAYINMKSRINERVSVMEITDVLCENTKKAVGSKNIKFEISGDDFDLPEHIATPLIAVMHELLSNTIKHAFRFRDEGLVKIAISKGDIAHSIKISDNGCGFDTEKISETSNGIRIVKEIIQHQLSGTIRIKSGEEGTSIWFDFIKM